ncbi:MAG: FG-GAP-like repeat-containing protein [bacterium]
MNRARYVSLLHAAILSALATPAFADPWDFSYFGPNAGITYSHGFVEGPISESREFSGGAAVGDYNNDGYLDIYVVRGNIGPNLLYKNKGNATFQEVGAAAGVALTNTRGCGPAFADLNGDGWLDLVIGGIEGTAPAVFKNNGNGTFQNVTATCGIAYAGDTYSISFTDYDRDGDLDVFMTHWGEPQFSGGHIWRNNGNMTFTDVELEVGFGAFGEDIFDFTWTANFADVNADRWPDLLLTSDYHNSELYLNDGDGTFTDVTTPVISDDNGMGASVGDFDNDGHLDWFVSSKSAPPGSAKALDTETGNRLYRNLGNGTFEDRTDSAGVRIGYWGWGTTLADFNNDGHLDIYQVNGTALVAGYYQDRSRMFVSTGMNTFTELGDSLNVDDNGQGRGVSAFDFDRDGDLDIFVANNSQPATLYRNRGGNARNWTTIKLRGLGANTEGIGARVRVTTPSTTQIREIRAGSNFVSQDPAEAHFGLNSATVMTEIRIEWPDGQVDIFNNIPANKYLVFDQSGMTSVLPPGTDALGPVVSLVGVAPNPAIDASTIRYRVNAQSNVRLRVFDVAGREVRTLADGTHAAGPYAATWDGRDASQRDVAAGVYFYRIESAGTGESGKITIIR